MAGKKNNGGLIVGVVALLAILIGGGYYFTTQKSDDVTVTADATPAAGEPANEAAAGEETATTETAGADKSNEEPAPATSNPDDFVVEEGNPVVAKVDGKEITRVDVYRFIQTMPANIQQLPAANVYPMAMEQVINTRIVQNKANAADVTKSDKFKAEMEMAKQQIARNLYLEEQVAKKVSEGDLKKAYKEAISKIPDVEERRARHILVETEEKAKAVLAQLEKNDDFAALAKDLSTGPTGPKGGDLGYFAKQDMVPEFANKAFAMKKGEVSKPVKTQFGWHVIKLEDVRKRPKPEFAQVKPMIEAEERRKVLDELIKDWRKDVEIVQYDINGKPLRDGANATGLMPAPEAAEKAPAAGQ